MNLVLLDDEDLLDPTHAVVRGRRLEHVRAVHRASVGDELRVGLLGGRWGRGMVRGLDADSLQLELELDREPPPALDVRLVIALPRPKALRRVLTSAVTLGVKQIVILHAYRVEKSYWQSPMLRPEALDDHLRLALEQACDTMPPRLELRSFFKPFVEDELDAFAADSRRLVPHPTAPEPAPARLPVPATLAFGPEGGFIPYEIEKLQEQGFEPVSLGPRVLRTETAVPALVGRAPSPE